MKPAFRIMVDGEDRTAVIADRLISLLISDEDGTRADRVEIELDDRDSRLGFPEIEARIEISLGWQGQALALMGTYAVDGVSGEGPAQVLRITGTAWDFLAQTAEGNLHFLTRIAAELDATCKPAGGALLVQRRGEAKTAAGDALTPPVIARQRLSDWSWSWQGRAVYRAAEAEWTEIATGITHKVKVGSGDPLKRLRHPFASEAEATRAAEAALSGAGRAAMELNCTLSGFEPRLIGGAGVTIAGLRPELNGAWHLKSVTHRLDGGGLVSAFQGERGKEE